MTEAASKIDLEEIVKTYQERYYLLVNEIEAFDLIVMKLERLSAFPSANTGGGGPLFNRGTPCLSVGEAERCLRTSAWKYVYNLLGVLSHSQEEYNDFRWWVESAPHFTVENIKEKFAPYLPKDD